MKCLVHVTIGEDAITLDDGQSIYQQIKPELLAGHEVELDFDGVSVFAAPFFNAAIGQLLKDLRPEELEPVAAGAQPEPDGLRIAQCVIENAKKYYAASAGYREAQAKVLERLSEGG